MTPLNIRIGTLFRFVSIFAITLFAANNARAFHCPFCSAIALTFSEQMESNDVVVVAKLLEVPPPSDDLDADFPKAKFEIAQVLKGKKFVEPSMKFRTQLVGNYPLGQKFLVMGVDPPKIAWTTPMKASDLVFSYLQRIQTLPKKGPERLVFFQNYFEHEESVLAFDAYDEFAKAPYEDLIGMKDRMQHEKLIQWIKDPETSVNRRRLYFTMLGVCGDQDDIPLLEELIKSDDRKKRAGLDALIACYLTLKGESGVQLIEQTFLINKEVDYVDTLAAVSALRFHGTEVEVVPKQRIVEAVRHLLDRPKMADMIIPDLARWEDWSVMERLVQMFKDADEETNWLRVPVITYLRSCPRKEAAGYIEELAKIDPDAVRRADFFLGGFEDDEDDDWEDEKSDQDESVEDDEANDKREPEGSDDGLASEGLVPVSTSRSLHRSENDDFKRPKTGPVGTRAFATTPAEDPVAPLDPDAPSPAIPQLNTDSGTFVSNTVSKTIDDSDKGEAAQTMPDAALTATAPSPSLTWFIVFVPLAASLLIFLLLWSVVNGWFERLIF